MEEVRLPSKRPVSGNEEKPKKHKKKQSVFSEMFSVVGILILAPLIAIFLTFFVFQSYVVDGPSMENTLHDQDRLIVWKASKTLSRVTNHAFIPDRYSIIVFKEKGSTGPSGANEKQLVKRVIGLPGDRIVITDESVLIYNQENQDGFYPDRDIPESAKLKNTEGRVDYTVKPDEVFVLGDNRGNSLDSRAFGAVKSEDIIGTLAARIYPFDKIQKF
jgi:signal peptidase I